MNKFLKKIITKCFTKVSLMFGLAIYVTATASVAEIVELTDGRLLKLNQNGSYKFINHTNENQRRYIKVLDPKFKITHETQDIRAVRFMPRFENVQAKTILGVKFAATFVDSFGETVFEFSGIHEDKLHYKEYTTTQLSFSFLEMHDRSNEPFEKLYPLVALNNANVVITVNAISFADGEIIKFE